MVTSGYFRIVTAILIALSIPTLAPAQSQWCPEGECVASCPQTYYYLDYGWWWCSCPTSGECMQDPMQTCNSCYTSGLAWCNDPFNPYCATYYLSGYEQFCGCQTGGACAEKPSTPASKRGV